MNQNSKIDFEKELDKCKTVEDLTGRDGLLQRMVGGMLQHLLEKEMEEHLGYEKYSPEGRHSGNSRNGKTEKTVQSSYGEIEIEVPRDRSCSFEPQVVRKRQRNIGSFDDKIISMYAKGMTTRDIQAHIKEIYGAEISPTMVSNITEKVLLVAAEWQSRPLCGIYPVVFFDAIHYKVREEGKIMTKAAYTCLGIDMEGKKEVLGLWIGGKEGAKFWLRVCSELKNRGVKDIFISCIDGLKGLPEAIKEVFPDVDIQLCIIHMIRNSIKYIPHKHSKEFVGDLKNVYRAPTEEAAKTELLELQKKWEKKYCLAVKPWVAHWENIRTFFRFPEEIRRLIYTTNAVESLHRQFRKITKNRAVFPSDGALLKLLFLSVKDLSKKWTASAKGWKEVISFFSIAYGDRLNLEIT